MRWSRRSIRREARPFALLDIAGGTGDVAFRALAAGGEGTRATVCDINPDMLAVGRERATALCRSGGKVSRLLKATPRRCLRDHSLRCRHNRIRYPQRAADRGGARGSVSRTSRSAGALSASNFPPWMCRACGTLYEFYSFKVIPPLGRAVVGDAESYQYLVESIRHFPKPQEFAAMLRAAGFARVSHQLMTGGIVALHSGWRL